MAVVTVKETFGNRTLAQDSKYQITINRQFRVICDAIDEAINNVTTATGIPALYDERRKRKTGGRGTN